MSDSSSLPTGLSGDTLAFDDEFDSFDGNPDGAGANGTSTWQTTFNDGNRFLAGQESEYYSDSTVGVNPFSDTNGILDIQASPGSNPAGQPYNSGQITTYKSFSQEYGYFDIRAQLPTGNGLWPAFWLLPETPGWPPEIDVFEILGNDSTADNTTIHYTDSSGAITSQGAVTTIPNASTGFHDYGVDWEPDYITFYVDGKQVAQFATPDSMKVPMYMLASLAVGSAGSWPPMPDASTQFPANMLIDYIRAYSSPNTINQVGVPLPADAYGVGAVGTDTATPSVPTTSTTGAGATSPSSVLTPVATTPVPVTDPGSITMSEGGVSYTAPGTGSGDVLSSRPAPPAPVTNPVTTAPTATVTPTPSATSTTPIVIPTATATGTPTDTSTTAASSTPTATATATSPLQMLEAEVQSLETIIETLIQGLVQAIAGIEGKASATTTATGTSTPASGLLTGSTGSHHHH